MTRPIAVVTGAASGLGRACVEAFLDVEYSVVGLDLVEQDHRPGLTARRVDITDEPQVAEVFGAIRADLGDPSVCINAAGVYPRSTLETASAELYRRTFDVNVLGTVLVTREFARCARLDGRSVVLNIASVDGLTPQPKSVLYSASKAAVVNLTAGLADELAARGIRVMAVAPDYIATDRVLEIVASEELPPEAMTPARLAEACLQICDKGGIALLTGQTLVMRRSAIEWGDHSHP